MYLCFRISNSNNSMKSINCLLRTKLARAVCDVGVVDLRPTCIMRGVTARYVCSAGASRYASGAEPAVRSSATPVIHRHR